MKDVTLTYTSLEEINIHALPGSNVDACLIEAARLCLELNAPVLLEHNSKKYRFTWPNLINSVVVTE